MTRETVETKQIAVRLPLPLIDWLEAEAERDERTLAWIVRKILTERMRVATQATKKK
jgi:hypothetical protein